MGYVGLVQGACLANLGHRVACVDINEKKIEALRKGEVPIFEPELSELIIEGLENSRLSFHTSQKEAIDTIEEPQLVYVAVWTPRNEDGSCDLSAIEAVSRELGQLVDSSLFVIKSTVPPGTREQIQEWLQNDGIRVAANPEFLRQGQSVSDFMNPDRILIGATSTKDVDLLRAIHDGIDAPVYVMSVESAQLAKYAANTFLASRLALINEVAHIADAVGADIKDVEAVIGSDPRIGHRFLRAGAGFGGSCFPKDVLALADVAAQKNVESLLIRPIIETNDLQPLRFIKKFGDVSGLRIAVWGLAFNAGTDDVRESPALRIVQALLEGGASVAVYDPQAQENARVHLGNSVTYALSMMDALRSADVLAVLTEWNEFTKAPWSEVKELLRTHHIYDGKNFLPREELEEYGFELHGMGLCGKDQRRPHAS